MHLHYFGYFFLFKYAVKISSVSFVIPIPEMNVSHEQMYEAAG